MREIKFRVWNGLQKKMEDVIQINTNTFVSENNFCYMRDRYELLQYTGLKDKNGSEIYEGDILDIGDEEVRVIYDECGFKYEGDGYISNQLEDVADISYIVGNKYERELENEKI